MSETDLNEYTPWIESGETELAYYKRRFLEESAEVERIQSLPSLDEEAAATKIARFVASVARGNQIDPKDAIEAISQWQTHCSRQRTEIARLTAEVERVRAKCREILRYRPTTDNVAMDFDLDGGRQAARAILRALDVPTTEVDGE